MAATPKWRKSSHSGDSGTGACVEIAFGVEVRVRDSKNVAGPRLAFDAAAWRAFVGGQLSDTRVLG